MKQLTKIKSALNKGGIAYWKNIRIAKIYFDSMNMGGKLMIRLYRIKIEVDIDEIKIITSIKTIAELTSLELKRKQANNNSKRQRNQINPRVRYQFWDQVAFDYSREIERLIK